MMVEKKHRVVITGLGLISPLGNNVSTSWQKAIEGISGIDYITRFDASKFATKIAGEVKNFNPLDYIDKKEIKKLDLFSQYAIAAAEQALSQAQLNKSSFDPYKAGCILGIGMGGLSTLEKYHQAYLEGGPKKISPFLIPAMISNLAPGNIAIKYGLKGINAVITSACTSATHAIGEAFRYIQDGIMDIIITGGSESAVTPIGIGGFCSMKALSKLNDAPTKASRPFDKNRDGFVLAEGAGILVLESLDHAEKRGCLPLAEIVGYGASCDAFHITAPCSNGEGAIICMKKALQSANLNPHQINYINAHGTSTEANDVIETRAIKEVFKEWAKDGLKISSTKSVSGHLLGAAGAIESIFCIKALEENKIPPTINLDTPDPECDLDYTPNKAVEYKIEYALSNSFGFGGTNGSVIFAKIK